MSPSTSSKNVVTLPELLGDNVNCSALLGAEKCLRKSAFFTMLGKTVDERVVDCIVRVELFYTIESNR
jgi:hypothetical protein